MKLKAVLNLRVSEEMKTWADEVGADVVRQALQDRMEHGAPLKELPKPPAPAPEVTEKEPRWKVRLKEQQEAFEKSRQEALERAQKHLEEDLVHYPGPYGEEPVSTEPIEQPPLPPALPPGFTTMKEKTPEQRKTAMDLIKKLREGTISLLFLFLVGCDTGEFSQAQNGHIDDREGGHVIRIRNCDYVALYTGSHTLVHAGDCPNHCPCDTIKP